MDLRLDEPLPLTARFALTRRQNAFRRYYLGRGRLPRVDRLHPADVRSLTYDSAVPISVQTVQSNFEQGYDMMSAQDGPNNVQARINVDTAHCITPP